MTQQLYHALILAGSRNEKDLIVQYRGVPHKALTPILGIPMVIRVLNTLLNCPEISKITICFDQPDLLKTEILVQEGLATGKIDFIKTAESPASSVQNFLTHNATSYPFLLTTADHPLLTTCMVTSFLTHSNLQADLCVGLATEKTIQTSYPQSVRTYYRMRDGAFSGCNLYIVRSPAAEKLIAFWQKMEKFRKKPLRLIGEIGWWPMIRFRLFGLRITQAFKILSKRLGLVASATIIPYAEAAIDVDKPSDFDLAESILTKRSHLPLSPTPHS